MEKTKTEGYIPPSIGSIGSPYYDPRNNRVKLFSTTVHQDEESIAKEMSSGVNLMSDRKATRFTGRFFATINSNGKLPIEAIVHLRTNPPLQIVYTGINANKRGESKAKIREEEELVRQVLASQRHFRELPQDYVLEKLSHPSSRDLQTLESLYKEAYPTYTIPLTREKIREMIQNSAVFAARHSPSGEIASICVAEVAPIKTNQGIITLCELSEMATRRTHRNRGLVTHLASEAVNALPEVNMFYAEARAPSFAINKSFHNLGFQFAGRLSKHCIISGDRDVDESGSYENLNVWYLNQEHE